jgi:ubiquitin carboxyl-terminal hydrolase 4/11/15
VPLAGGLPSAEQFCVRQVSITFDPFTSLTLPLPAKKWQGVLFVVPADPNKPRLRVALTLPNGTTIGQLKVHLGEKVNMDPKTLFCMEVFSNKFYKDWSDIAEATAAKAVASSAAGPPHDYLVFYELPFSYPQYMSSRLRKGAAADATIDGKAGRVVVPVTMQCRKKGGSTHGDAGFGLPFVVGFQASEVTSYDAVYNALVRRVARLTRKGAAMFEEAEAESTEATTGDKPPDAAESNTVSVSKEIASATPADDFTPPQIPSHAEANPKLFRILVNGLTERSDNVPTVTSSGPSAKVELAQRIAGVGLPSSSQMPGTFNRAFEEDDDELRARYEDVAGDASPSTGPAASPVIRTGDALVLEVPEAVFKAFFESDSELYSPKHVRTIAEAKTAEPARKLDLEYCLNEFSKKEKLDSQNTWCVSWERSFAVL